MVMPYKIMWLFLKDLCKFNFIAKKILFLIHLVSSSSSSRPASVSQWNSHSRAVVLHTLHIGQRDTRRYPLIS